MTKGEINKLLNTIKGYYNSQFFIDEFVTKAWIEELKDYEYDDCEKHLKKYLKENPDYAPKPHTFTKGLLTREERQKLENEKYFVECNLCHKWMGMNEYNEHYGRCLDIEYLVDVANQKGENITRKEIEHYKNEVLEKLLKKYKPKENINFGLKVIKE